MTGETNMYRQIRPGEHWMQAGLFTSLNFRPMPKDEGLLSVDDGNRVSAEDSWACFTETTGGDSAGVAAFTAAEAEACELPVTEDPLPENPAHCVTDFNAFSENQQVKKAKRLKNAALARGWQFQPELD